MLQNSCVYSICCRERPVGGPALPRVVRDRVSCFRLSCWRAVRACCECSGPCRPCEISGGKIYLCEMHAARQACGKTGANKKQTTKHTEQRLRRRLRPSSAASSASSAASHRLRRRLCKAQQNDKRNRLTKPTNIESCRPVDDRLGQVKSMYIMLNEGTHACVVVYIYPAQGRLLG